MYFELEDKKYVKNINYQSWLNNSEYWLQNPYIHYGLKEFFEKRINDYIKNISSLDELKVVDIGCGSGWLTQIFENIPINYLGIDYNPKFIDALLKRFKDNNKYNFELRDIEENSKNSFQAFDLAICCLSLIEMPSIEDAFRNISNMLKVGGSLFIIGLEPYNEIIRYSTDLPEQKKITKLLRNNKNPIVLSKHIVYSGKESPEDYYRILYDLDDYIENGKKFGLEIAELSNAINKKSDIVDSPVYTYVKLTKK